MIGVSDACPAALETNKTHLINTDWLPRMHLLHPMFYIKHAKKIKTKRELIKSKNLHIQAQRGQSQVSDKRKLKT